MKIFSTLTIALLIIFQAVTFAAVETFSASGEYLMSDYDTPEIAEEKLRLTSPNRMPPSKQAFTLKIIRARKIFSLSRTKLTPWQVPRLKC